VTDRMLESWNTLGFVAGKTEHLMLGTMVTGVTYRYLGVLVKIATTLDVLSGGRTYFGIGAGWNEFEHLALGVPFPPVAERFRMLEEALQIALQMWAGNTEPYNGRYYHLAEPINVPNSVQRPHPPILIGGGGERKTLRLVARYGDSCNLFADPTKLPHKLEVLRAHCEAEGRPYGAIEKTTLGRLTLSRTPAPGASTPSQAIEHFHQLAELGIDQAVISLPNVAEDWVFDLLGSEIVPAVKKLVPAGRTAGV
jgi:F420-dependent oxidoreductase-like protein